VVAKNFLLAGEHKFSYSSLLQLDDFVCIDFNYISWHFLCSLCYNIVWIGVRQTIELSIVLQFFFL